MLDIFTSLIVKHSLPRPLSLITFRIKIVERISSLGSFQKCVRYHCTQTHNAYLRFVQKQLKTPRRNPKEQFFISFSEGLTLCVNRVAIYFFQRQNVQNTANTLALVKSIQNLFAHGVEDLYELCAR